MDFRINRITPKPTPRPVVNIELSLTPEEYAILRATTYQHLAGSRGHELTTRLRVVDDALGIRASDIRRAFDRDGRGLGRTTLFASSTAAEAAGRIVAGSEA